MMFLTELLENLINKKKLDKETIQNKINIMYAMNVLQDEEYSNLTLKIQEAYKEEIQKPEVAITDTDKEG